MEYRCVSCNTPISAVKESTMFNCPRCGELIVRCGKCRRMGVAWVCPKCRFEGP